MRTKHHRRHAIVDAAALLGTLVRYWATIFPLARRELAHWRARAEAIPDTTLRRLAQHTLEHEGFNAEGAALFATIAPAAHRRAVVRLLVRFQVMYDYLDLLTEQPTPEPLATSRQLHLALLTALGESPPSTSYYAYHPCSDDDGYLDELIAGCRAGFLDLPASAVVAPHVLEAARRSSEGQSYSHASVFTAETDNLIAWATSQIPLALDLRWWEAAAASESSLVIHGLLVAAADPDLNAETAVRVAAAYWPWITGLNALLDDLVDRAEDATEGTHSYAENYPTTDDLAQRLAVIAGRASTGVRDLPRQRRHAVVLAAMTSFYLAAPGASAPLAQDAARRVRAAVDMDLRLPLAMLALRRRLAELVKARRQRRRPLRSTGPPPKALRLEPRAHSVRKPRLNPPIRRAPSSQPMSDPSQLVALGRAIRRARVDRDLTQEALSERTGVHVKALSEIERGRRDARTTTVLEIIEGLGMPASDFYALYDRARAGDTLTP